MEKLRTEDINELIFENNLQKFAGEEVLVEAPSLTSFLEIGSEEVKKIMITIKKTFTTNDPFPNADFQKAGNFQIDVDIFTKIIN